MISLKNTATCMIASQHDFVKSTWYIEKGGVVRFSGRAISRCHAEQKKPLVLSEAEGEASGHSMRGQVRLRETLLIRRPDPSLTLRMTKGTLRMTKGTLRMTNERNGLLTMRLQDARKNSHTRKRYPDFLLLYILGYDPAFSIIGF